jgi:hypothetical protein
MDRPTGDGDFTAFAGGAGRQGLIDAAAAEEG